MSSHPHYFGEVIARTKLRAVVFDLHRPQLLDIVTNKRQGVAAIDRYYPHAAFQRSENQSLALIVCSRRPPVFAWGAIGENYQVFRPQVGVRKPELRQHKALRDSLKGADRGQVK